MVGVLPGFGHKRMLKGPEDEAILVSPAEVASDAHC